MSLSQLPARPSFADLFTPKLVTALREGYGLADSSRCCRRSLLAGARPGPLRALRTLGVRAPLVTFAPNADYAVRRRDAAPAER